VGVLTNVERRLGLFSRHDCCVFMLWCDGVISSVGQLVEAGSPIVKRDRFDYERNEKPKILTLYIDVDSTINRHDCPVDSDVRVIHDVVSRISLRAMDPTQIKLLGSESEFGRGCDGIKVLLYSPSNCCRDGIVDKILDWVSDVLRTALQSGLLFARVRNPMQTIF
jgi:hypothetical protein